MYSRGFVNTYRHKHPITPYTESYNSKYLKAGQYGEFDESIRAEICIHLPSSFVSEYIGNVLFASACATESMCMSTAAITASLVSTQIGEILHDPRLVEACILQSLRQL